MTYERLKQFLILSICSVLLLGLIAEESRAQMCLMVDDGTGSAQMARKPGGGCERVLESDFEGSGTSITGGFSLGDDDETNFFSGTGLKSFPDWVTDDIKRGRNDDEFCTNVVENIGDDYSCNEDGRYAKGAIEKPFNNCDESWNANFEAELASVKAIADAYSPVGQHCFLRIFILKDSVSISSGFMTSTGCSDGVVATARVDMPSDLSCMSIIEESDYISNDDLAKKFNDLDMSDFKNLLNSPAYDQYMEELEKIGIHWTGKLETEKKKVEEKIDYHPDGSQSVTELYESKEYSYNGQTNSNNNKLYPTEEKTHSTTVVDGKITSSGTSTKPGKGAGEESGNGSGDGDGPLDAKVDGSQIGLGESPEIPELYQQKYKNTDWAEIVEDGLQDNPMLDNLKGIGSQYTTGVCPSFEQEFFGELIVIDIPCELLDMIRAFFLTISTISAFWIIFRRA
ncbi:MAG: hypothetical protein GX667_04355 [Xanthomonadaceae bacterium]|nr:hypothetical protein [Xanthomonadaceae bacterium]